MRKCVHFFFLLLFINAGAQPKVGDAVLQLNPGGHLSQISEGIVTPDRKFIITTSTDKTICIWDAQKGILLDQIRGPKSVFNQGKLYSVAISPDSRYLAVGGFLAVGTESDGALAGRIRIYDFSSRKLLTLLEEHQNVVTALRFSADGKYLLSGAVDSSLVSWEINPGRSPVFKLQKKILRDDMFAEDMQTFGNSVLVTEMGKVVKYTAGSLARKRESKDYGLVFSLSVDGSSNTVAAVCDSTIVIMDTALVEKQVIRLEGTGSRVALSPAAKFLVTETEGGRVQVFSRRGARYEHYGYADFEGGATLLSLGFINDKEFFAGGGTINALKIFTIENGTVVKRAELGGSGMTFTGIGADATGFFLDQDLDRLDRDSFSRYFDLRSGVLTGSASRKPTSLPKLVEKDSIRLDLEYSTGNLLIYTNDELTASIHRDGTNGYKHRVVTITRNNLIVSASAAGFLNIYNNRGRMIAALVGHEGDLLDMAESENGDYLYSSSMDQTIRTWDLRELESELHYKQWAELGKDWQEYLANNYPGIDFSKTNSVSEVYQLMIANGDIENAEYLIKPQEIRSRLNLFMTKSGDWVMWNNSGYFKSSASGANYIGWYIYKGDRENAEFYTADKLFDNYYRPDIVNELLTSNKPAVELLASMTIAKQSVAQQVSLMPRLSPLAPKDHSIVSSKDLELVFALTGKEYLDEVVIYQNGKRILFDSLKVRSAREQLRIPVTLVPGDNQFRITVFNKNRVESDPHHIGIKYTGVQPAGSLYILTIGVDQYRNSRYNLNYAKADARGMAVQLSAAARSLYKDVFIDSLFDKEATVENLQNKLSLLKEKVRPEDVFVFFYAGHGVMSEPEDPKQADFFLVLHNVTQMVGNEQQLLTNGFSSTSIKRSLLEIAAQKQLVFFDACNAGGAISNFTRGSGEEAAILQLARSTGFTVLSSTNQEQLASEVKELGHGIFTYALLQGINGEADLKKDGKVTVKEIELYLNEIIPQLSEKYKGTQQFPQSFSRGMDFPLTYKEDR